MGRGGSDDEAPVSPCKGTRPIKSFTLSCFRQGDSHGLLSAFYLWTLFASAVEFSSLELPHDFLHLRLSCGLVRSAGHWDSSSWRLASVAGSDETHSESCFQTPDRQYRRLPGAYRHHRETGRPFEGLASWCHEEQPASFSSFQVRPQ